MPHQTIADGIRALLIGADLQPKFWPYAFRHFLRIYNMTPHAGRAITPFQICFDQIPDLSRLCTRHSHCQTRGTCRPRHFPRLQTNAEEHHIL
jgi:hypothetical protein